MKTLGIIATILAGVIVSFQFQQRANLPSHLLGHPVAEIPDLFSPETAVELQHLVKEMAIFPTNVNDLKFYDTIHEDIGEARPLTKDGLCDHPFMVPSVNGTQCNFPGRIDVGRHYIKSGGVLGLKESYMDLITRVQSFGRYIFDISEYPLVESLFADPKFLAAARSTCPDDKPVLDPFQFNFIMQIPGQTVTTHLDGVYFWGATRFQFPQWLLAAMKFSGLWEEKFVDQIQLVAYLHDWQPDEIREGDFVYWDDENPVPKKVSPVPRAGSAVDGSKTVHAAKVYYPSRLPPRMDKSKRHELRYQKQDDSWDFYTEDTKRANYPHDDLRISMVYRARCFKTEEERKHFNNLPEDEIMNLDDILNTFEQDLIKRGKLTAKQVQNKELSRLDLGLLMLDEYTQYPFSPSAIIPFNYCAIPRLPALRKYSWLQHIFGPFCDKTE